VSTYAGNAEIAAALRVHTARLEKRLAFGFGLGLGLVPIFGFAAGSGSSECDKGHSEENGGFEELHCCK
jgi:hypothetical protein